MQNNLPSDALTTLQTNSSVSWQKFCKEVNAQQRVAGRLFQGSTTGKQKVVQQLQLWHAPVYNTCSDTLRVNSRASRHLYQ